MIHSAKPTWYQRRCHTSWRHAGLELFQAISSQNEHPNTSQTHSIYGIGMYIFRFMNGWLFMVNQSVHPRTLTWILNWEMEIPLKKHDTWPFWVSMLDIWAIKLPSKKTSPYPFFKVHFESMIFPTSQRGIPVSSQGGYTNPMENPIGETAKRHPPNITPLRAPNSAGPAE